MQALKTICKCKNVACHWNLLSLRIEAITLSVVPMIHSHKADCLLYADSFTDPDMFYLTRVWVPDPFLAFRVKGKKVAVVNQLEFNRVKKKGDLNEVLLMEQVMNQLNIQRGKGATAQLIVALSRHWDVSQWHVGAHFPLALGRALEQQGLELITQDILLPQRYQKTINEHRLIEQVNAIAAKAIGWVHQTLGAATIQGGQLVHEGRVLTSEWLRQRVQVLCLEEGAEARSPIIACGEQACDPHEHGSGPLLPHVPIIVDVFPRHTQTGYYGDMTRTFVKGSPSDAVSKLINTVWEAQRLAIQSIAIGVTGAHVHGVVQECFVKNGYKTEVLRGKPRGFIHSTGHGLGLELHEGVSLGVRGEKLDPGMVVTVEPGLYYPGLGAARIEDVFSVTGRGAKALSRYPYLWHIP
jgi:Xaa-Pro aminopeptidase